MRFETLQTSRLTIRRLLAKDAEILAAYRSLPEVQRFQSQYTLAKARALVQEMAGSDPSALGKWFQFGIELTEESRLIGDIGFLNTDPNGKSWIGFTLDPVYWHRGYATEAVRAVLDYYYASLGIHSIWASTDPTNHPSMKLLRVLGFSLVDSKPDDMVFRYLD